MEVAVSRHRRMEDLAAATARPVETKDAVAPIRIAELVRPWGHERDSSSARAHQGAVSPPGRDPLRDPEDALPDNHRARLLWRIVETLDLSAFTAGAKAIEGQQGRALLSVHMLLTLWLYAISGGIGSARTIARRIGSDDAFRWIVGEVSVGHAKLSEFRVGHLAALDTLMTDVLASLMHKGLLSLDRVAQDGTRIRASASAPSFRREASLLQCREQAALHVKAVFAEADDPDASETQKRAREAAALEYLRRVEAAIDTAGSEMGGPRTIVGVRVTNVGSDMSSVAPMLDQIERRTGALPAVLLADGGHAKHECIRNATERGVEVIIPVPDRANKPDAQDDPAIAAWHERMATHGDRRGQAEVPRPSRPVRAAQRAHEVPPSYGPNARAWHREGLLRRLARGSGRQPPRPRLRAARLSHAPSAASRPGARRDHPRCDASAPGSTLRADARETSGSLGEPFLGQLFSRRIAHGQTVARETQEARDSSLQPPRPSPIDV
jgi:transposase